MDFEKKYNDALFRASKFRVQNPFDPVYQLVERIFPELEEGERMGKAIRHVLYENYTDAAVIEGVEIAEIVAWLEKLGKQKQTWEPNAAQLIVIKDLIEDKNTSKVNKVILRGMFDEFKQFTDSKSSQFSSGHLLGPDKVIAWLVANICDYEYYVKLFKKDFEL